METNYYEPNFLVKDLNDKAKSSIPTHNLTFNYRFRINNETKGISIDSGTGVLSFDSKIKIGDYLIVIEIFYMEKLYDVTKFVLFVRNLDATNSMEEKSNNINNKNNSNKKHKKNNKKNNKSKIKTLKKHKKIEITKNMGSEEQGILRKFVDSINVSEYVNKKNCTISLITAGVLYSMYEFF